MPATNAPTATTPAANASTSPGDGSLLTDALGRNAEALRTITPAELRESVLHHARYSLAKPKEALNSREWFKAVALAARDILVDGMLETEAHYTRVGAKRLYYLSMEFLIGRSLGNNLTNLGLLDEMHAGLRELGVDIDELRESEPDAALGNGGLGRLAACFLDSLATLGMPGFGYGINYEYGLFRQEIENGYQREKPDNWAANDTPWEIVQPEDAVFVPLYGRIEHSVDRQGGYNPLWLDWKFLVGVPHIMPIVGYGGAAVNYLKLYSARSSDEFDIAIFNTGDYLKAVRQKIESETISKVLYPSDTAQAGRELRLVQEYFLVACAVRDIVRRYLKNHSNFDSFPSQVAIQLNDTHPALTVAELMRILVDENDVPWDRAWEITTATLGYTNHTLMSEALEKWPVPLFEYVLPRHLQLIYEINRRFLETVSTRYPGDNGKLQRMSVIEESQPKQVRMAHLSIVGSHSVNGVSALHSELVKHDLVPDFYGLWPEKFNNKTNGVTQRRWLLKANPGLADLVTRSIGDAWITNLDALRSLEPFADDPAFQEEFAAVKRTNKLRLAGLIQETAWVTVNPDSLFDVQTKRIHEYKRQLLKVLHIIHEYLCITEDGATPIVPRTYIFAGKAAPGYWAAKQIIKLVNSVAQVVNRDARTRDWMKVAFIPDYRVSVAEKIMPAADLSEQISTAGTEASGTGNMKFALNGALTIGTLDGANIEIMEEVGADNIFIFGLRTPEIVEMRRRNAYVPRDYYNRDSDIRRVMDTFKTGLFAPREPWLFNWIFDNLVTGEDHYFHLADAGAYFHTQNDVSVAYTLQDSWRRKAVLNVARVGKFSSDRTIREYARDVWGIQGWSRV